MLNEWVLNETKISEDLLRTDWESTVLGGGRECLEGAMLLSWAAAAASVCMLMVAILLIPYRVRERESSE